MFQPPTRIKSRKHGRAGDLHESTCASLTIGELARRAGVLLSTARSYNRAGLLTGTVTRGGRRLYSTADVVRIRFVVTARAQGATIEEVKAFLSLADSATPDRALVTNALAGLEERIQLLKKLDSVVIDLAADTRPATTALQAASERLSSDVPVT
jgi:DNA-binding transcriptional MerR regulator